MGLISINSNWDYSSTGRAIIILIYVPCGHRKVLIRYWGVAQLAERRSLGYFWTSSRETT